MNVLPTTFYQAIEKLEAHVQSLEKRANDSFPKIEKLKELPASSLQSVPYLSAFCHKGYYSGNVPFTTVEQVNNKLEEYRKMMEEDIQRIKVVHEENIPKIESNKILREKITFLMEQVGMPSTWTKSYFKSSRSRTRTTERCSAGYVEDLRRCIPVDDGAETKIRDVQNTFDTFSRKAVEERDRINKEQKEKQEAEQAVKSARDLAWMQVKYGLPSEAEWSEVKEAILEQDKYLKLASAMESTRNDWSDGFYRVEYALSGFIVENDADEAVVNELTGILGSEESDGRVFRDCTNNYTVLYGLVKDETLVSDLEIVQSYTE